MSRPLRLEFPGAVYHVTSRGDRREPIFVDDEDRLALLDVLAQAADRFDAQALAYCLMGNHYHLVLHTRAANLSRFMRHLNGVYTQRFNRRHGLVGHLFQGRFKAILVDRDAYLLALCRYVERNPVAAGLVPAAGEWPWSSFRAHVMQAPTPDWLDSDGLHGYLLGRTPASDDDRRMAARQYARMVVDGTDADLWARGLRQQVFLGDEDFVARTLAAAPGAAIDGPAADGVPKRQRQRPGSAINKRFAIRRDGRPMGPELLLAYTAGGVTMTELARSVGLSVSRVSRLIKAAEAEAKGKT